MRLRKDALAASADIGRAKRIEDAGARYIEFAKRTYPGESNLDGLRIVIDTANGAAYKTAPTALVGTGRGNRCALVLNPTA